MERIIDVVNEFLPTEHGVMVGGMCSVTGIVVAHLFGGWSVGLEALVLAMVIDYITGVLASLVNPALSLDSRVGFRGIIKKVVILLMVSTGYLIDATTGTTIVMPMVLYFYLANEFLSITENAANAGLPIPRKLKVTLRQVRNGKVKE